MPSDKPKYTNLSSAYLVAAQFAAPLRSVYAALNAAAAWNPVVVSMLVTTQRTTCELPGCWRFAQLAGWFALFATSHSSCYFAAAWILCSLCRLGFLNNGNAVGPSNMQKVVM